METLLIRILLIGPLPPPMGGATRHFLTLYRDLEKHPGYRVSLINTSRQQEFTNPIRNAVVALRVILDIWKYLRRIDIVSYHASERGMYMFAPLVVVLCKVARKPVILRVFGGSFGDYYLRKGMLARFIIRRFILSANVVLLQTKRSIQMLQEHATGRLEWFSTYVTMKNHEAKQKISSHDIEDSCHRFVFLGHLWKAKGIETMLGAAPALPENTSIDIFGPLDEYSADEINVRGLGRVRYCGFLTHSEVEAKLQDYHCLILPTYHRSEGYPGVIAEALTQGIPVITTNWLAIPEIVDQTCGILIEPNDTAALVGAVTAMNADRDWWIRLRRGALARATIFDHKRWARKFESICADLAG